MYWALMVCNFKQQFAYRASLYMKILGSLIRVYIQVCIWQALLRAGTSVEQTVEQLVAYTVTAFLIAQITHNNTAQALATKVKEGAIAIDLIRPFPLKWYLFYQQLSENMFNVVFVGIPVTVMSLLLWSMCMPGIMEVFFGMVSMVLAVFLTFSFQYAVGLLVFWLKDVTYTKMITGGIVELFSGSMIPLWFYPEVFRRVCMFLPFRFMVFEPISVFLGNYGLAGCIWVVCIQLFWIIVLNILGGLIWEKIQNAITVQGG
jgi:ABC-2 type transport system permease protein